MNWEFKRNKSLDKATTEVQKLTFFVALKYNLTYFELLKMLVAISRTYMELKQLELEAKQSKYVAVVNNK